MHMVEADRWSKGDYRAFVISPLVYVLLAHFSYKKKKRREEED